MPNASGPHLLAQCGPGGAALLTDAADLLIHHVRRQTAIQKQEKQRIKQLLRHFLPDLFSHPRHPLSDDERDDGKFNIYFCVVIVLLPFYIFIF